RDSIRLPIPSGARRDVEAPDGRRARLVVARIERHSSQPRAPRPTFFFPPAVRAPSWRVSALAGLAFADLVELHGVDANERYRSVHGIEGEYPVSERRGEGVEMGPED